MTRSYEELRNLRTFNERYDYLRLRGAVGAKTFGSERWINQRFYTSRLWRDLRKEIIVRDNGLDLGCDGYPIKTQIYIHHINPLRPSDLIEHPEVAVDPDNLISVSLQTHNAIHYNDSAQLPRLSQDRSPGDTTLW